VAYHEPSWGSFYPFHTLRDSQITEKILVNIPFKYDIITSVKLNIRKKGDNVKKLIQSTILALSLAMGVGSTITFAAETENYVHKTPTVYENVNTNSIYLKIPVDSSFRSGKVVWQVQQPDGTWENVVYPLTRNPQYYAACSMSLGISKPSLSIPQYYRVKMINSTAGTTFISDPVKITPYAKY
ncbi:hypothetical protein, partial [Bacillus sp. JJ783]|uniref:hypothetical protein n=1 Tax=Bacillus sp. JJ783 TaxID=3122974 RepID=UPI0030021F7D